MGCRLALGLLLACLIVAGCSDGKPAKTPTPGPISADQQQPGSGAGADQGRSVAPRHLQVNPNANMPGVGSKASGH